ncbi:MAG: hypothetical protein ALAOOOJD_03538 [bacterium]|nr:hypothetical protein [bacterium]
MFSTQYSAYKFLAVLLLSAVTCFVKTESYAQIRDTTTRSNDPLTLALRTPKFVANPFPISSYSLRLPEQKFSPLDTLHMSAWERLWWGRHGVMRLAFKLDEQNPVNDLRQIAKVRRKMLNIHQVLGMATVASMAVTVTGGFKAVNGRGGLHESSLPFTIGLYSTTAFLALASPPKLVSSRQQWDSIRVHRLLAAAHLAGMIITPMLAPEEERTQVKWHRALGVATFATFSTSMLVVMIFH